MNKQYTTAIILAAGSGSRMGSSVTKQRMEIFGKSVLLRSVEAFSNSPVIDSIIIAAKEDELELFREEFKSGFPKIFDIVVGGKNRAESAKNAFAAIPKATTHVAIHDAARCLVTPDMIALVADAAYKTGAATAGSLVTDTVKQVSASGFIEKTLPRSELFFASTPQIFETKLYKKALDSTVNFELITDDNMLLENIGERVTFVDVGRENIKITTPSDIDYAEHILKKRSGENMSRIRIGHGYDVHKFAEGRELVLGGVNVPYKLGLLGHSDADVLTHAIMDSRLGAAALGDIGRHFPDSSDEFRGISSLILLKKVGDMLSEAGYSVINIDATLVLQSPKILPFVDLMISNVADVLGISRSSVNIKATTEEHLGFTGRGEGAAAHSVALIEKR